MEPLPGLVVTVGLTDTQVAELAAAVRMVCSRGCASGAGQVAGRRGRVVAVGDRRAVDPPCQARVRQDDQEEPF